MRSKFSVSPALSALLLGVALLIWLLLGDMQGFNSDPPQRQAEPQHTPARVEVSLSQAQPHTPHLILQGQLEPRQEIELRSRHAGKIEALPQPLGAQVEAGDLLIEFDAEDLPQQLARAEADLELKQAELAAGNRLSSRDMISGNELLRLKSELAEATAELAGLRQSLDDTRLTAPFAGVLNQLDVEVGEFIQLGETVGQLVEIDTLIAQGWVPQSRVKEVNEGLPVDVTLLDGRRLEGRVSFVASRANDSTRSFALEVDVDNAQRLRIAGASATLKIALEQRRAHRLSPARLVLDEQGRLGVKHVDDDDIVRFTPVSLLSVDARHAWVSGLPDQLRLITLGGGFVSVGERVTAVAHDDVAEP